MRKLILTAIFISCALAAFGQLSQFRMVGSGSWSTVNDSTFSSTVTLLADLTANGFLPTGITDTMKVFSQRGQRYRISSATNLTFSTADLVVVESGGNWGAPIGQILVYETRGLPGVPAIPFGSTGSTAKMQEAAVTYNATFLRSDSTVIARLFNVNQAGHGFSIGDMVAPSPAGWYLSVSEATGDSIPLAMVARVYDTNTFALNIDTITLSFLTSIPVGDFVYLQSDGSLGNLPDTLNIPVARKLNSLNQFAKINWRPIGTDPGSGGGTAFVNLIDVPSSYAGQANRMLIVNPAENGLIFADTTGGSAGISVLDTTFTANYTASVDFIFNNLTSVTESNDIVVTLPTPSASTVGVFYTVNQVDRNGNDLGFTLVQVDGLDYDFYYDLDTVQFVAFTPDVDEAFEFRTFYLNGEYRWIATKVGARIDNGTIGSQIAEWNNTTKKYTATIIQNPYGGQNGINPSLDSLKINLDKAPVNIRYISTLDSALNVTNYKLNDYVQVGSRLQGENRGGGLFVVTNSGKTTNGGTVFALNQHLDSVSITVTSSTLSAGGESNYYPYTLPDGNINWGSFSMHDVADTIHIEGIEFFYGLINYQTGETYWLRRFDLLTGAATGSSVLKYDTINSNIRLERVGVEGHMNIDWFGAVRDDSTFNNAAIVEETIRAADANSISNVFIPTGNYFYQSNIQLSNGIRLYGNGPGLSILKTSTEEMFDYFYSNDGGATFPLRTFRRKMYDGALGIGSAKITDKNTTSTKTFYKEQYVREFYISDIELDGRISERLIASDDTLYSNIFDQLLNGGYHNALLLGIFQDSLKTFYLDNVHLHDFGGNLIIKGIETYNGFLVGNNITLGNSLHNHLMYSVNGIVNNLNLYGYSNGTFVDAKGIVITNLRANLTKNPYPVTGNRVFSYRGEDLPFAKISTGSSIPIDKIINEHCVVANANITIDSLGVDLFAGYYQGLNASNINLNIKGNSGVRVLNNSANGFQSSYRYGVTVQNMMIRVDRGSEVVIVGNSGNTGVKTLYPDLKIDNVHVLAQEGYFTKYPNNNNAPFKVDLAQYKNDRGGYTVDVSNSTKANLNGDFFSVSYSSESYDRVYWFDITGSDTQPVVPGITEYTKIDISATTTAAQIRDSIIVKLDADSILESRAYTELNDTTLFVGYDYQGLGFIAVIDTATQLSFLQHAPSYNKKPIRWHINNFSTNIPLGDDRSIININLVETDYYPIDITFTDCDFAIAGINNQFIDDKGSSLFTNYSNYDKLNLKFIRCDFRLNNVASHNNLRRFHTFMKMAQFDQCRWVNVPYNIALAGKLKENPAIPKVSNVTKEVKFTATASQTTYDFPNYLIWEPKRVSIVTANAAFKKYAKSIQVTNARIATASPQTNSLFSGLRLNIKTGIPNGTVIKFKYEAGISYPTDYAPYDTTVLTHQIEPNFYVSDTTKVNTLLDARGGLVQIGVTTDISSVSTVMHVDRNGSGGSGSEFLFRNEVNEKLGRIAFTGPQNNPTFQITPFLNRTDPGVTSYGLEVTRGTSNYLAKIGTPSVPGIFEVNNTSSGGIPVGFRLNNGGTAANSGTTIDFLGWLFTPTNAVTSYAQIKGQKVNSSHPVNIFGRLAFSTKTGTTMKEAIVIDSLQTVQLVTYGNAASRTLSSLGKSKGTHPYIIVGSGGTIGNETGIPQADIQNITNPLGGTNTIQATLDSLSNNSTDDQIASEVPITDSGSNYDSTHVEGALIEIASFLHRDTSLYVSNDDILSFGTGGGILIRHKQVGIVSDITASSTSDNDIVFPAPTAAMLGHRITVYSKDSDTDPTSGDNDTALSTAGSLIKNGLTISGYIMAAGETVEMIVINDNGTYRYNITSSMPDFPNVYTITASSPTIQLERGMVLRFDADTQTATTNTLATSDLEKGDVLQIFIFGADGGDTSTLDLDVGSIIWDTLAGDATEAFSGARHSFLATWDGTNLNLNGN